MPGVIPKIITHKLNVDLTYRPMKQKRRNFTFDRSHAIEEKVSKLLEADFIREVQYPKWLTNVIMVKKATDKWWIYIDYTNLNKACPKDSYPLSMIDRLVDATSGFKILCFMDAFSGYNQIRMVEGD